MKRFHIHVGVKNLDQSIRFYTTLFGQKPSKQKEDYAKWMLEDPCLNFAISTRTNTIGVDHLGIQVDEPKELETLTERLKNADLRVFDEGETTCCYAQSNKAWVEDPSGVAWEAYQTMADAEVFKKKAVKGDGECCPTDDQSEESCC
jgi:catechol 2,3-dioxygenase-like lactoylglutathione lyase family enzyme